MKRPHLITKMPYLSGIELLANDLFRINEDQAITIVGLQKALRIAREEMEDMRKEHKRQLMYWATKNVKRPRPRLI